MVPEKSYIKKLADVPPVSCPCGSASRIVTGQDDDRVSVHRVVISAEARKHFHSGLTEYYFILSGEGRIELDDTEHAVSPGDLVCIVPGTRHALRGEFEILNIVVPDFDPGDEQVVAD